MANRRTKNWFPLLVLTGLIIITVFVFRAPQAGESDSSNPAQVSLRGADNHVLLPVAVEKLSLGTGPLKPGDQLVVNASLPQADGAPLQFEFPQVIVYELLGTSGPVSIYQRSDIKTVVLGVQREMAAELQSVLLVKDAQITYQIVAGDPATAATAAVPSGFLQVMVPMDQFTPGTGPFSPGDYIDLTIHYPGEDGKTLEAVAFLNVRVTDLLSVNGSISPRNWNAIQTILLEVPSGRAVELVQALAKEGRLIEYSRRTVAATSTPTITPTTAATLPPLATPGLTTGWAYIRIPLADISDLPPFVLETPKDGRLIIVYQIVKDGATEHSTEQFCVKVLAYLDENGKNARTLLDKKASKTILLSLPIDDLARYGNAMATKVLLYLVEDAGCGLSPQ